MSSEKPCGLSLRFKTALYFSCLILKAVTRKSIFSHCFLLFFVVAAVSACSKKEESSNVFPKKEAYSEMLEERERNQALPPIDPSICPDASEGNIYFQVGEEVFRYGKASLIKLPHIPPNHLRVGKVVRNTNVPEGCAGNPYTSFGFGFNFDVKDAEKIIGRFRLDGIGLSTVLPDEYYKISPAQERNEKYFYLIKEKESSCEMVTDHLTRCGFKDDGSQNLMRLIDGQYMSDNNFYTTAINRPYVLDCHGYVSSLLCESAYRLYPSVDVNYAFFPKDLNKKNIIEFDKYIRNLFENMRVKAVAQDKAH